MIDRRREDRRNSRREAADAEWTRQLEGLPEEVRPDRDLWPTIAARLAPRPAPWWRRLWPETPPGGLLWPAVSLAAVVVLAIGFGLWTRSQPQMAAAPITAAVVPAGSSRPVAVAVATTDAGAELQRLRRDLVASVERRQEDLAPETVAMVEETLAVLDAAIAQVRAALVENPGNIYLNHKLAEEYRREAAVLSKLKRI